jgi:choline monooxygenase
MTPDPTGNAPEARPPLPQGAAFTLEETYRATWLPVDRALMLNPEAYRSPDYYDVERQRIFSQGWVRVGYTVQLVEPGDTLVASVGGQPIVVTRDQPRHLHAFSNVCRHRGSLPVSEGGPRDVIRCPDDSWGYARDGRLLGAPSFKGLDLPASERAAYGLAEVKGFRTEDDPGGRMDFRFEESIPRFQNILIDLMTGNLRTPPGDEDRHNARSS